ncbi:hypothetical protein LX59_00003 [Azomonas agilis]|uniref:Uncharacterized protein n=1 Tax=Azomonas agilis TaxID=116849 RepID=A0A562HZL2_9GAMM|nr:hypothetical protein [Azomonas agilis]TWH63994.1 hypothetical protein LX59_02818 [Azomonas agilis]TWH76442.1 hypothetical protein LX59_00478 [Azomonas agilis]TWH77102.1 hypothetical protein LX59_00003 [Azomonas agilis]
MKQPVFSAAQVADESLETVRYGVEHTRWLTALMAAIPAVLDASSPAENRMDVAKDLARLGHYLAHDCSQYLNAESERLDNALNAVQEVK